MNASESRSELILDLLSLDGWLPTSNATALGSARVKELSKVVEKGKSFRNAAISTGCSNKSQMSPRIQRNLKSETFDTVAVKGVVLSVNETFSTIKRMPARIEIMASKDQHFDRSLMRIEDDTLTSTHLAMFFNTIRPQGMEIREKVETPINFIDVSPVEKGPLESTLNVTLAPWHFERLKSPEKMAVFHSRKQAGHSNVSVSQRIIEDILKDDAIRNLPSDNTSDIVVHAVPINILSSKLSVETDEVSKLKSTLDEKIEIARSLAAAETNADKMEAEKLKFKKKKVAKTKKKMLTTSAAIVNQERPEKQAKSKSTKSNKKSSALSESGDSCDSKDAKTSMKGKKCATSVDSDEHVEIEIDDIRSNLSSANSKDWENFEKVEVEEHISHSGIGNSSELHKKRVSKKIAVNHMTKLKLGGEKIDFGSSVTDNELLLKLKNTLESAQKLAGNASQLINMHRALDQAHHYLADLKSRISGLGLVGADKTMQFAFRQGSYKLNSCKGHLCMILRMFSDAVDMYTAAFEFCDWLPEILFLRAHAQMKQGAISSAQKDLDAAKSILRDGFVEKSKNPSQFKFQNDAYMNFVDSISDVIASAQSAATAFDDEMVVNKQLRSKQVEQIGKSSSHKQASVLDSDFGSTVVTDGSGNHEDWPRSRVFALAAECDVMIHNGLLEEVIRKCDLLLAENSAIGLAWAIRGRAMLILGKHEEGLRDINRGVTCWGECYECRLYRALAYRQSDPISAELDLDLCTQMSCCGSVVYVLRASIKENMHQKSDAAIDWEFASKRDSARRNEYRLRACKLLLEDNRRTDCLHKLERLVSVSPHYIAAYILRAELLVKMGNIRGAVLTFSRALMIEPWNSLLYFKRAQVLQMQERFDDSMRDLVMFFRLHGVVKSSLKNENESAAADRQDIKLIELYCKALISLQYWQEVILVLQKNEKLVKESCPLQTLLGHIYFHIGYYGNAELHLRRAMDMNASNDAPESAHLSVILLGWSMCMQGSWIEGESAFSIALSSESTSLNAIFGLGCCSMNYGNFDAAATRFSAGLVLEAQHPGCLEGRAIARYRSGRLQEAISDIALALRSCQSESADAKSKTGRGRSILVVADSTYARWKRTKGLLHVLLGDLSIAEQEMTTSLEFEPNCAIAHTWRAFLRMRRGLWGQSVDLLKMSLSALSDDLNVHALLIICFFKLNDWSSVIQFSKTFAAQAWSNLNSRCMEFKLIFQELEQCTQGDGIDKSSTMETIGDLEDLIEQLKFISENDSHRQLQKKIASLTATFLGHMQVEKTNAEKNEEAEEKETMPGILLKDIMIHNGLFEPISLDEKVSMMKDRWQRVEDAKTAAFLPDNLAVLYIEAMEHMKMNKDAMLFFEHYINLKNLEGKPMHNDMLLFIARAHIERARNADPAKCAPSILLAKKYLLVLLHQDPFNVAGHLCMAYLWCHDKMLDQAEHHIMTILQMDPTCTEALQLRAQFNASLGNFYAAEADISMACRINTADANLLITYASIRKLIPESQNQVSLNLGEALGYRLTEADIVASAIGVDSNQRNVLVYIGLSLLETSRFQDAADIFSKCISLNPFDAVSFLNRGIALSCLRKFNEAREDFQVSARLYPYNADVYLNWAFLEDSCQKSGIAQRLLEKAVDVSPLDADLHEVRANFYAKIGRGRKGRLAAQTAHWLKSDNFDQAKTMGLRFWNFMLDRERGITTCDNMGIYGISNISLTLVAKARPLSVKLEDKEKPKGLQNSNHVIEDGNGKLDQHHEVIQKKKNVGAPGKSPRIKFIQSVPMHDGIGRLYTNHPTPTAALKPMKKNSSSK